MWEEEENEEVASKRGKKAARALARWSSATNSLREALSMEGWWSRE